VNVNEAVEAAWTKVTEDWANQARHDALLALTVESQAFKWVASKYREKKGDAIADAQLARLTTAAMATMMTSSRASAEQDFAAPYRRALLWLAVLAVMLVLGLIAAKLMVTAHPTASP
jgi:hypothetical protein